MINMILVSGGDTDVAIVASISLHRRVG